MLKRDRIFLYFDFAIMSCLCLLIFCLTFTKAGVEAFAWTAILFWIFKRILGYRAGSSWAMFPNTELNAALGIFILVNALSIVSSVNPELSLRGFFGKQMKFIAIYFMLVEVINSKERLNNILIAIIASAALMIVDAGVQYFSGMDFMRGFEGLRLTASFGTPNSFAAWLIVIILMFAGILMTGKVKGRGFKILFLTLIMLLTLCLLLTYSRGAWLGFLIGVSLIAWYGLKNFDLRKKLFSLSVGVSLVVIFLILPQPIRSKVTAIGRIFKPTGYITINARIKTMLKIDPISAPVRLNLWREALRITRDYPLTGCGLNTYSIVARDYKSFDIGGIYPHNSYLHMAAETGLPGLFVFLWVLFTFFKIGLKHLSRVRNNLVLGLLAGILAFLVHAFLDNHLYSLQLVVLFWFMLGLTVTVINLDRRMA